jgi:hypothetical protein
MYKGVLRNLHSFKLVTNVDGHAYTVTHIPIVRQWAGKKGRNRYAANNRGSMLLGNRFCFLCVVRAEGL